MALFTNSAKLAGGPKYKINIQPISQVDMLTRIMLQITRTKLAGGESNRVP